MTHDDKNATRSKARELDRLIGRGLRSMRQTRNRTQQEIADALGVSFQQIQKYERGDSRVSAATALIWLAVLGVLTERVIEDLGLLNPLEYEPAEIH